MLKYPIPFCGCPKLVPVEYVIFETIPHGEVTNKSVTYCCTVYVVGASVVDEFSARIGGPTLLIQTLKLAV